MRAKLHTQSYYQADRGSGSGGSRRADFYKDFYTEIMPHLSASELDKKVEAAVQTESEARQEFEKSLRHKNPNKNDNQIELLVDRSWASDWEDIVEVEVLEYVRDLIQNKETGGMDIPNLRESIAKYPSALKTVKFLLESWKQDNGRGRGL